MRKMILAGLVGSVALSGAASAQLTISKNEPAAAPKESAATSQVAHAPALTEEQVQKIVEKTIMENPTLIIESLQNFEKQRMAMAENAAIERAQQYKTELFSNKQDPQAGNPNATITIVEFLDYQCGYCKRMHSVTQALLKENANVKVVYKLIPVLGERSERAAQLALSSLQTGKFDQVHKSLMENKGRLTDELLAQTSKQANVSPANEKIAKMQLQGTMDLAQKLQVDATPTLYILKSNGEIKVISGYVSLEKLQREIASQ